MENLPTLLNQLESKIPYRNKNKLTVSQASVGWHIEHSLLVITEVIQALLNSIPGNYKPAFSWKRIFIYSIGKIPRGKAKAPRFVLPEAEVNLERIKSNFAVAKIKIVELSELNKKSFFKHPYFGNLNLKQSRTLLNIHTKHHLKIIEDIIQQ